MITLKHTATLQHAATSCNILHHIATNCNTLQRAAARCSTLQDTATTHEIKHWNDTLQQHTATIHYNNTLQQADDAGSLELLTQTYRYSYKRDVNSSKKDLYSYRRDQYSNKREKQTNIFCVLLELLAATYEYLCRDL